MSTTLCSVCGCSGESDDNHIGTVFGKVYNYVTAFPYISNLTVYAITNVMVCVVVAGAVLHAMAAISDNCVKQVLIDLCMHAILFYRVWSLHGQLFYLAFI